MPKSEITIPHSFSQGEALRRVKNLVAGVKSEHEAQISELEEVPTESGGTFSFKAGGGSFKGTLTVTDSSVKVSLDIPVRAMPFKGRIENTLRKKAQEALEP